MSDLPPSIADGTGTVRRVWKNRVIAESDATYAEQLQEDEIAENREYFGQIREAELASLRAAQALQQQEHARVQRQQSLNQDAAARDAAFAQQLLREEALALQRQRDAEARANAEAIRAAATEERRAAAFAAHQAQQSQAQAISSVQSQHSPAVRAGSAPLPQRTGSSSNLNTPPAYSPIAGSAGSSSSGGSNSNITVTITTQSPLQRQATDPGFRQGSPVVHTSVVVGNRAVPTPASIRYMVSVPEAKSSKDVMIKNQKFQDAYGLEMKNWKSKNHAVLYEVDTKATALEIRLLKDSNPKTFHLLRNGTEIAGIIAKVSKTSTKLDLVTGPGQKWTIEGDFNGMILTITAQDLIPIAKVLGKSAEGKGQSYVVEIFNDIRNAPLILGTCLLIGITDMFKVK